MTVGTTETPAGKIDADTLSEIDAAISSDVETRGDPAAEEVAVEEAAAEEETEELEVEAPEIEVEPGDEAEAEAEEEIKDEPEGLSEGLIERAVRAGVSLSEAKQYPSESLLEKMVSRIEGQAKDSGSRADAGEVEQTEEGEGDPLSTIPSLDPETYDESIVEWSKKVEAIVRQQSKELQSLRKGGSKDWLATQLDGVKDFTKGDSVKTEAVTRKFKTLKAGYKAVGESVSDGAVFNEAASWVLSKEMAETKQAKKATVAKKRETQFVSRASGRRAQPKADAEQEAIDSLNEKYFSD